MTPDERVAALERERVRDPDHLEEERHRPGGISAAPGLYPAYTPLPADRAVRNLQHLASALNNPAPMKGNR